MQTFRPASEAELADHVTEAAANGRRLSVTGSGSHNGAMRPIEADIALDLSAFSGVIDHDPTELVLTAGAATPLAEIIALLDAKGQMLAFEPPLSGPNATIGGAIATNAGGPRRFAAGAARDHFLGFRAVSGKGEAFKAGGRVIKNVTGFDLAKVIAGSWGTLAVLTEVTLKVVPRPRTTLTMSLDDISAGDAIAAMARACGSAASVTGAAYLPSERRALLRLEGFEASVAARAEGLSQLVGAHPAGDVDWQAFADPQGDNLWRVPLPAAEAAALEGVVLLDWAGGLAWVQSDTRPHPRAVLWRGDEALRRRDGGFPPLSPARQALERKVKQMFDPADILNRGLLGEDR